jgi:hypothetical protein
MRTHDDGSPAEAPTPAAAPPLLLFLIGPPAVGKMTVGRAICERTGLKLFHNHVSIEVALRYFEFGTPEFLRISRTIRTAVVEEIAASTLPGLVFTFVWAFDLPEDEAQIESFAQPFRERGGRVLFVELEASLDERLVRDAGAARRAEKPSKRDSAVSRRHLIEFDEKYLLNSDEGFFDSRKDDYLRIDNTSLSAATVAEQVVAHFDLPRC